MAECAKNKVERQPIRSCLYQSMYMSPVGAGIRHDVLSLNVTFTSLDISSDYACRLRAPVILFSLRVVRTCGVVIRPVHLSQHSTWVTSTGDAGLIMAQALERESIKPCEHITVLGTCQETTVVLRVWDGIR